MKSAAQIVKRMYDLDREATPQEVRDEIEMCRRHRANLSGDDFIEQLSVAFEVNGIHIGEHGSAL